MEAIAQRFLCDAAHEDNYYRGAFADIPADMVPYFTRLADEEPSDMAEFLQRGVDEHGYPQVILVPRVLEPYVTYREEYAVEYVTIDMAKIKDEALAATKAKAQSFDDDVCAALAQLFGPEPDARALLASLQHGEHADTKTVACLVAHLRRLLQ